jgi:hypothetical protein
MGCRICVRARRRTTPRLRCAEQAGRGGRGAAPDGAAAEDAVQPDDSLRHAGLRAGRRISYEGNAHGTPLSMKAVPLNIETFGRLGTGPRATHHPVVPRAVPAPRAVRRALSPPRPAVSAHRKPGSTGGPLAWSPRVSAQRKRGRPQRRRTNRMFRLRSSTNTLKPVTCPRASR